MNRNVALSGSAIMGCPSCTRGPSPNGYRETIGRNVFPHPDLDGGDVEKAGRATGKNRPWKVSRVFCAALAAVFPWAHGDPVEAFQVRDLSPSVRVNGMGEAGVALPDEPAGYYNPGSAALSSPAHTLQSRFYLSGMPVITGVVDYSYYAVQAATERVFDRLYWKGPTRIRTALYGYRMKLDNLELDDPSFDEIANNIGTSLALKSVVNLGIGATLRWISGDYIGDDIEVKGSARSYDLGLMSVVPVVDIVERLTRRNLTLDHVLHPKLDVGLGIMWENRGRANSTYTTYTDTSNGLEDIYPLHTARRHGWSYSLGMDWRTDSFSLAIGRMTFSREISRETRYFIRNEKGIPIEENKKGIEISIMETVSIRQGEVDRLDWEDSVTSGWTVRSDGLFKIVSHFLDNTSPGSGRDKLRFLARHLSVSWSRFDYTYSSSSPIRDRAHSFIGLSF